MHQHSNHFSGNLDASEGLLKSLLMATLATAAFRCWHILIFFAAWATAITVIDNNVHKIGIQSTLLTVLGTVLGFVISYRTTSSFERYNEGRRYWSQIILASRTLARLVWFHVPDLPPDSKRDEGITEEERRSRTMIEKKTVINLIEAFSVAVKHYLRGEDGINYVDLYHLVKFLPSYAFPEGIARNLGDQLVESSTNLRRTTSRQSHHQNAAPENEEGGNLYDIDEKKCFTAPPATIPQSAEGTRPNPSPFIHGPSIECASGPETGSDSASHRTLEAPYHSTTSQRTPSIKLAGTSPSQRLRLRVPNITYAQAKGGHPGGLAELLPAAKPPKYSILDVFPFSLFVKRGKKAVRYRAKTVVTHNVPLEISMYLTSYVATLQNQKGIDNPTTTSMINTTTQLVDALTGLERILTTPIPFSYSIHLWLVTIIYCLALPFQIVDLLHWITIPGTTIVSFIFFGFLVAGEEIENPFGYDRNDLNLDHFTHNIIRNELLAITAFPPPEPSDWVFHSLNNCLFLNGREQFDERGQPLRPIPPTEWVRRGSDEIKSALASY